MTWWRRQRTSLIALAVAVAACIGVHVWLDVLPTVKDEEVAAVASGQNAETAGQQLSLISTRWDEFDAPEGMRSLSVLLKASGGPDAGLCGSTTLTEPSSDRSWLDGRSLLDVPSESGESTCTSESDSYDVLAVFVVPDDTAGPFELDVPGDEGVIRFSLEP